MAILGQQAGVSTARPFVFGAGAAFVAFGLMTAKLDSASSLPAATHPPPSFTSLTIPRLLFPLPPPTRRGDARG